LCKQGKDSSYITNTAHNVQIGQPDCHWFGPTLKTNH
jgi:hypothetical protein